MARKAGLKETLIVISRVLDYEASPEEQRSMLRYAGSNEDPSQADVHFWAGEAITAAIKEYGLEAVVAACEKAEKGSLGSVELVLIQSGLVEKA